MSNDRTKRFACSALLLRNNPDGGFNYQMELGVVVSTTAEAARAFFGMQVKDQHPKHGLWEVLVMEIDDHGKW